MLETIIPVLIVLVVLQLIIKFMQSQKTKVRKSEWRNIDYKKRIDAVMKGQEPDKLVEPDLPGKTLWFDELRMIPEDMRDVRRDLNLIREAVSVALRAKIGKPVKETSFHNPEKMFDEIAEVVKRHIDKTSG